MYLPLSKKSRRVRKTKKGARHHAKAKAKNRRRVQGMARRALGTRIGRAGA
ncbi:MAG: hypothetical protein IPL19_10250 [Sandaracinaceae bacterium]|jgi:hypothetical protein|nr:hypothetical protein [Sandaracinaceae bacterium]MBK7775187.1 hypothetical protein [Sandaracinaceae bacterium]MBK8408347.1 hypothetical protein [Sandaracinaceae bacterium]MBK8590362.1 hypothetical protein [Sandaracinaceae bacterium]MBP7680814.1 hypothetical protein [Deltaproteobacteria bacterium]